jgi:hypothetical protein
MKVAWIAIREAKRFIRSHHRHLPKIQGAIAALGLWVGGQLRGVALIGRGCREDGREVAVITRLCTDGCKNGCSKLYAKAKRLAQAFGFNGGIKTFTRQDESGSSLFAVGAEQSGMTKQGHWSREGRGRRKDGAESKRRWKLA